MGDDGQSQGGRRLTSSLSFFLQLTMPVSTRVFLDQVRDYAQKKVCPRI